MAMGIDELHERLAEVYNSDEITKMAMRPNPLFAFIKKQPAAGTIYVVPVKYEDK